jgi:tetratricopeptide (TPR) repeat protein
MLNPNQTQAAPERGEKGGGITEFIQKHRTGIFVCLGIIAVSLVGFFVVFLLHDTFRKKANAAIEELGSRYETLRPTITEDFSAVDVENLLSDLETFAKKTSGYAGSKAWSLIGSIHSEKKEWAESETAWAAAANAAPKIYLTPLAWFNAGVAAEEQGKTVEAIDYYTKSLAAPSGFPAAPRAQFSVGRLKESLGETSEAVEAYRAVISDWSYDQVWVNLAYSRIIVLEGE